jgi:hypothetical protein
MAPIMNRASRIVLFDVAPALVLACYLAFLLSMEWCKSHHAPVCAAVPKLLGALSFVGGIVIAPVLTVALGMTLSMIVRRAFTPAGVKRPGMKLGLAGLVAIPATGHFLFLTPGLSSGWGPPVVVIITAVIAVAYVPCLIGFRVNRAAFSHERQEQSTVRIGADGLAILVALHLCFALAALVAARDLFIAMHLVPGSDWAIYEFALIAFIAGFPWNWAVLLLLSGGALPAPGSGLAWSLWLGVVVNYALFAWVTFRAIRSRFRDASTSSHSDRAPLSSD